MVQRDRSLSYALNEAGESAAWHWDKLPAQEQFLTAPEPFTCFSGGFGSGKTTALCAKIILLMTAIPNNLGYLGRLDGKSLRHSTLLSLLDMLPKEYIRKHNEQNGFIQLHNEVGGSKLVYGDFKDLNDLKNIPLGFYAIDQMEEVPSSVWEYLAGRIRRRTPVLLEGGARQYYVAGRCRKNLVDAKGRHYATSAYVSTLRCALCREPLPPYSDQTAPGGEHPPWDLIVYKRYGFGVCNPEGPSHWIFKTFWDLPGSGHTSTGKVDKKTGTKYRGFHASIYDGLHAGFIDSEYVGNLETLYADKPTMWDRYMLGTWIEAEGLVYPSWNRGLHTFDLQAPRATGEPVLRPGSGWLFEYIDHGLTAATAVGWLYTEPCDCGCGKTNFYLLDEHYEGGKVVSYHAAQIKAHRLRLEGFPIQATYLDSQAFSRTLMGGKGTPREDELYSIADEFLDNDISVVPNQKDWKVGHDKISGLLLTDPNHVHPISGHRGAPHLLVSRSVGAFIKEIETYKWKVVKGSVEPRKDEAVDGNDHHMDGLNGFLASRPAEIMHWVPPAQDDWAFERELSQFAPVADHMRA
jgi:hypothetical protein